MSLETQVQFILTENRIGREGKRMLGMKQQLRRVSPPAQGVPALHHNPQVLNVSFNFVPAVHPMNIRPGTFSPDGVAVSGRSVIR